MKIFNIYSKEVIRLFKKGDWVCYIRPGIFDEIDWGASGGLIIGQSYKLEEVMSTCVVVVDIQYGYHLPLESFNYENIQHLF